MKYKNSILAAALAFSLSACGINHGDRLDIANVNAIQHNVTTEAQVRAMFGEPVSVEVNQKLDAAKIGRASCRERV